MITNRRLNKQRRYLWRPLAAWWNNRPMTTLRMATINANHWRKLG